MNKPMLVIIFVAGILLVITLFLHVAPPQGNTAIPSAPHSIQR